MYPVPSNTALAAMSLSDLKALDAKLRDRDRLLRARTRDKTDQGRGPSPW
jgi:hypothetical protein